MPIQRAGTPPSSQEKVKTSVLGTLSAWTDPEGEDEALDEEREKPQKKLSPLDLLANGEAAPPSTLDFIKAGLDVDSDFFNISIGIVIMLNAVLIGVETDWGSGPFVILEHVFNSIFLFEMLLRIYQLRPSVYFTTLWYLFDCSLVIIGSMDLWVLPLVTGGTKNHASQMGYKLSVMRALRIVRLMRVLRVIRLFRMFNQLFLIMKAFNKAFQVVLLISLLVLIIDYVVAIMLTQAIGHQSHLWKDNKDQVELWFGTIGRSMQTLFVIMTLSNWDNIVLVLMEVYPAPFVIVCTVFYIMVTSYTMLSLITGILSDSLVTSQNEFKRKKLQKAEDKKLIVSESLRAFLHECLEDELDAFGSVAVEDLKTAVRGDTDLLNQLAEIGIVTSEKGMLALLDKISKDGQLRVNTDYFVNKLTSLHGIASASFAVDLKYDVIKIGQKLDQFAKKWEVFAIKTVPGVELAPVRSSEPEPVVVISKPSSGGSKRSSIKGADAPPVATGAKKKMNFAD